MTYKDRDERRRDLVLALGHFDLSELDRRLLEWLSSWDQETTNALADLFGRLIRPGR